MSDLNVIYIDFTNGDFNNAGPHKDKLKEIYKGYKKALEGKGCKGCRKRRINAQYKGIIKKLLAADI